MEMEHARDSWNQPKTKEGVVAVNLEQFRNYQVGEGYQAEFVVRQKTGHDEVTSKATAATTSKSVSDKKTYDEKDRKRAKREKKRKSEEEKQHPLLKYLQCEGLRRFRKEIQKIEESVLGPIQNKKAIGVQYWCIGRTTKLREKGASHLLSGDGGREFRAASIKYLMISRGKFDANWHIIGFRCGWGR